MFSSNMLGSNQKDEKARKVLNGCIVKVKETKCKPNKLKSDQGRE